jgi:hypothetical protein
LTALNGGATYDITASLNAGQTYTLTAAVTGYTFGTVQFIPATTVSETLTMFNPSTTGFRVGVNPALSNMTASNFTLLNSSGNPVTITGLTALNGGATYDITASLNAGQTYTLTAAVTGYTFGTVQFIPATIISETLSVFNPSSTGFRVGVSPAISNMTINDFALFDSAGNPITITSVTVLDDGATYDIKASLSAGQIYKLTAAKTGYVFGTAQFIPTIS